MDFFIKKNATLPVLKLQVVKDGRSDYDNFMKTIELSSIFFSMVDADTGIPKISSKPAGFVEKTFIDPNAEPEYYIYYQLTPKDTNRVGKYEGQFMLRNDDGVLILPIREKLHIYVQESFIADDLAYESCYVSEFPCCVNGPYTTTTTTTPCPSCGPSLTPSPTPEPSPTPIPLTPTPTPTPTSTLLPPAVLDTCTVLINNYQENNVYAYYPLTNTKRLLGDYFPESSDIAHTTTKMWMYSSNIISEYDITLNPWSATFNRTITVPLFQMGSGLGAVSNTQVITSSHFAPSQIIVLDLTTNTAVPTVIGELKPNRLVTGDILITTTDKILVTNYDITNGDGYLTQYSYPSATFELEVKLNPTIGFAYGLFIVDEILYIAGGQNAGPIYTINLDYPYDITFVSNAGLSIGGASQPPICNNVNLNLQPTSSPTPTPTPTPSPTPINPQTCTATADFADSGTSAFSITVNGIEYPFGDLWKSSSYQQLESDLNAFTVDGLPLGQFTISLAPDLGAVGVITVIGTNTYENIIILYGGPYTVPFICTNIPTPTPTPTPTLIPELFNPVLIDSTTYISVGPNQYLTF